MRIWILVCALAACPAFTDVASADSGSITGIAPAGSASYTATYVTTSTTCATSYFCGWFPYATFVGANEACDPNNTTGRLTYVGTVQDDVGTQGPATAIFYPTAVPFKLCLHISRGPSFPKTTVAEAVYTPPAAATPAPTPPPSAPTPAPTPQVNEEPEEYVPMTIAEARSLVPAILKKEYRSKFAKGSLTRSCLRTSSRKVRCRVSWRKSPYQYHGAVTIWYGDDDAAGDYDTYTYSFQIKRSRTRNAYRSTSGGDPLSAEVAAELRDLAS